jgi:hypothetical protein
VYHGVPPDEYFKGGGPDETSSTHFSQPINPEQQGMALSGGDESDKMFNDIARRESFSDRSLPEAD